MCKHVIKLWYETGDALYLKSSLCCLDVSWLSVVSNNFEGEGLGLSQSMNTNLTLSDFIQMGCVKPDTTQMWNHWWGMDVCVLRKPPVALKSIIIGYQLTEKLAASHLMQVLTLYE